MKTLILKINLKSYKISYEKNALTQIIIRVLILFCVILLQKLRLRVIGNKIIVIFFIFCSTIFKPKYYNWKSFLESSIIDIRDWT